MLAALPLIIRTIAQLLAMVGITFFAFKLEQTGATTQIAQGIGNVAAGTGGVAAAAGTGAAQMPIIVTMGLIFGAVILLRRAVQRL